MRIKFFSYFMLGVAAIGATACSDDLTVGSGIQKPGETIDDSKLVYMSLGLDFVDTAKSRSTTNTGDDDDYASSTDGIEYSSIDEYDVRTAIIVLAKTGTYDYLAHADVTGILASDRNNVGGNNGNDTDNYYQFSTIGRFKYSSIASLYDENGNILNDYKEGVNIFVFCNPTGDLLNRFETTDFSAGTNATDWVNWTGEVIQEPSLPGYTPAITNSIWAPRSFLMSNAKPAFAELPDKLSNWDYYNQDTPFNLSGVNLEGDPDNSEEKNIVTGNIRGPIYVERAVARIDLRKNPDKEDWRYQILGGLSSSMHDGNTNESNFNFVDVQLTRVSLVNMSKNFNFIRRVSPTGLDRNSTLMGVERSTNYVVDTDALTKQSLNGYDYTNAFNGFNFTLFTDKNNSINPSLSRDYSYDHLGWYTDNIADIMSNNKYDNTGDVNKYNIWRYVTENTIPQDVEGGNSRQVAVQSTGVVFKGLILPGVDIDKTFTYSNADNSGLNVNQLRYVPEEVVDALLASKYHLPRYGTGEDESTNPVWKPEPGKSKSEKENDLSENAKESYSYIYPTLYVFQGSIYAGFKTVVMQAQLYDGEGGLMYNSVNSSLGNWWANLDDLNNDNVNGVATFVWKGSGFKGSEEETEGNWLQLNVDYYNKIINGFPGERIVQNIPIEETPERFAIDLNEKESRFRELLTTGSDASRFTMYDASYEEEDRGGAGWGYYCYYFWWFKHNDNNVDGRMGPMEFATVRNNVYKLTVNKISSLGHSLNNLNDPDPLTPDTPDEDDKVYIDVNMKIVPWVVRINKVEF